MTLRTLPAAKLTLDDERDFRHVGLFRDLRQIMVDDGCVFRVPAKGATLPWGRALFLNLIKLMEMFPRQPEKLSLYMQQHLLENPSSPDEPEPPPAPPLP